VQATHSGIPIAPRPALSMISNEVMHRLERELDLEDERLEI